MKAFKLPVFVTKCHYQLHQTTWK